MPNATTPAVSSFDRFVFPLGASPVALRFLSDDGERAVAEVATLAVGRTGGACICGSMRNRQVTKDLRLTEAVERKRSSRPASIALALPLLIPGSRKDERLMSVCRSSTGGDENSPTSSVKVVGATGSHTQAARVALDLRVHHLSLPQAPLPSRVLYHLRDLVATERPYTQS